MIIAISMMTNGSTCPFCEKETYTDDPWHKATKERPEHEDMCDIWYKGRYGVRITDCIYVCYSDDEKKEPHFYHEQTDRIIPYKDVLSWRKIPNTPVFPKKKRTK